MSAKTFIISVSLAGSAAALACWMFAGENPERAPTATASTRPAPARTAVNVSRAGDTARADDSATAVPSAPSAQSRQRPVPVQPLTTEELAARAARVEQEANHELRRLVELLDLSEEQQDKVFQTLAQHSPSWSPGLQVAPAPANSAATAGKRSEALTAAPGLYLPSPVVGDVTAPVKAPVAPGEDSAATDPMDEIMALLSPDQQDTLLQEEMDRAAWWAEILEQITPPDDIPAIDGKSPSSGPGKSADKTQIYEGADVLE